MVLASTGTGDIIPDATVTVRNPGTSTAISETIFANDDPDTTQLTNGVFKTDARGLAIFYLTNQKRVDVLFTKAGVTSVTIPVDVQKSSLVSGESVATSTIWDAAGDLAKGTGADTAARLARGTAGQVLKVNAGGTDIEWGTAASGETVAASTIWDAKGDLAVATAADTAARKAVGTNGAILLADSGQSDGLRYALPVAANVNTLETTTSITYADLATVGPAATVTVGASGMAVVIFSSFVEVSVATATIRTAVAVSGATTVAAPAGGEQGVLGFLDIAGAARLRVFQSKAFLVSGLTAGSNTFTMKYKVESGTGTWADRGIVVIPL